MKRIRCSSPRDTNTNKRVCYPQSSQCLEDQNCNKQCRTSLKRTLPAYDGLETIIESKRCLISPRMNYIDDYCKIQKIVKNIRFEKVEIYQEKWEEESQIMLSKLKIFQDSVVEMMRHSRCSICMEFYNHPATLGCGHTFCMGCISQWKDTTLGNDVERFSCPVCRYLNSNFISKNPMVCEIVAQLKKLSFLSTS